jgi:isocitrate lyase
MAGYSELQEENLLQQHGFKAVKHQGFVGHLILMRYKTP